MTGFKSEACEFDAKDISEVSKHKALRLPLKDLPGQDFEDVYANPQRRIDVPDVTCLRSLQDRDLFYDDCAKITQELSDQSKQFMAPGNPCIDSW